MITSSVRLYKEVQKRTYSYLHICHHSFTHNRLVLSLPAQSPAQFPVIISQGGEVIITGLYVCVRENQ